MPLFNFLKNFFPSGTNNIAANRDQLLEYIDEVDLESIKIHLEKYPDLLRLCMIHDDKMMNVYGSFLNYALQKREILKQNNFWKWEDENPEKAQKYDNIILYFIRHEDTDLLAKHKAIPFTLMGGNFFNYLSRWNYSITVDSRTKKFISAMLEREEFKINSDNPQVHRFLQNERYIQLSSSQRIFNINYQDQENQTFAHYLLPYCGFDEVLRFLQRGDVDLSLLNHTNLLKNFLFFLQKNIILDKEKCIPYLITMIDLLKKKNVEFYLNNKYSELVYKTFSTISRETRNLYESEEISKGFLYIASSLLRNNENKITLETAKNFFGTGFSDTVREKLNEKDLADLINSVDCEGNTLLHLVLEEGMIELTKLLMLHDARAEVLNNDGYTALHLAAFKGHLGKCRNLLPKHSNSESLFVKENDFGETPESIDQYILDNAGKEIVRNYEVMDLQTARFLMKICKDHFKNHQNKLNDTSNISNLHSLTTFYNENTKIVFGLSIPALILKTVLNTTDRKGNTILHVLLTHELIRHRDGIDLENPETKKRHEIFAAIIEDFVKYGFNATTQNQDGDTAMHIAAKTGSMNLFAAFAILEKNGPTLGNTTNSRIFHIENHEGKTPMEIIASATAKILGLNDGQQMTDVSAIPENIAPNKFGHMQSNIASGFKISL